jgi:hypothetical protein
MIHPTITQFQHAAELLDVAADPAALDAAIVRLAALMDLASDHLAEDDMAVLLGIGRVLYLEGLQRKSDKQLEERDSDG